MGSRSVQGMAGGYLYEAEKCYLFNEEVFTPMFSYAIHNTGRIRDRVFISYIGVIRNKDIRQTPLDYLN